MTQRESIGFGSIQELETILTELSARKIFLVMDRESFEISRARRSIEPLLAGCEVEHFSDFEPNPKVEDVQRGIERFRLLGPDAVLAVGGGSVIDMAKIINAFALEAAAPREMLEEDVHPAGQGKPLIAVPTTAGSGSEATHFAVVYIGRKKYSVAHDGILPDAAIIDPTFSMSLPPQVTAASGMDALGQAMESYWSIHSTEESKEFASQALELVLANVAAAVHKPTREARLAMARGANLAGKAINLTLTTACHAISYPITSYFGVPHGHAVALTLPSMLEYNAGATQNDVLDARGAEYVRETAIEIAGLLADLSACGHAQAGKNVAGAKAGLERLMDEIGLERRLSRVGLRTKEDIETIVAKGFHPDRVKNNPRRLTKNALRTMLERIY